MGRIKASRKSQKPSLPTYAPRVDTPPVQQGIYATYMARWLK